MASNPSLVTAHDEQQRCCVLDERGERCPRRTRFWVGANGIDDYTHVCAEHLDDVKREGDVIMGMTETVDGKAV